MFSILTINISVELFGMALCLIFMLSTSILADNFPEEIRRDFYFLFFCEACVLFSDAMAGLLRGKESDLAGIAVRAFNFLAYTFNFILVGVVTCYVCHIIPSEHKKRIIGTTWILVLLMEMTLVLNLFGGFYYYIDSANLYHRGGLFLVAQGIGILCAFENLAHALRFRKKIDKRDLTGIIFYTTVPIAAMTLQAMLYGLVFVNMSFILVLIYMFIGMQARMADEIVEQRQALQESRMKLMMSQIKPHFLFNSLTSIAQLCDDDPKIAKKTTIAFANYLRGNLDSISEPGTIPFEKELNHVRNYLEIEKVRFGDHLQIVYDIETTDFRVPPLSLQPAVENAVKHGVGMKEEGGTVLISTRETEEAIVVLVKDDGVGFTVPENFMESDRVGIKNIRERLEKQIGAAVRIESAPGEGTEITITIPKILP